jgi:DNA-binding NtrC family response regulator
MGIATRAGLPTSVELSEDPRRMLAEYIVKNDGNLLRAAHELGMSRNGLRAKIKHYELWPVVNATRRRRIERGRKEKERQGG